MCSLFTMTKFSEAYIITISLTSQIGVPLKLILRSVPCNDYMIWRVSNMHVQFALRSKWLSWVMPFDLIHAFSCNEPNGILSFPTQKKEKSRENSWACAIEHNSFVPHQLESHHGCSKWREMQIKRICFDAGISMSQSELGWKLIRVFGWNQLQSFRNGRRNVKWNAA